MLFCVQDLTYQYVILQLLLDESLGWGGSLNANCVSKSQGQLMLKAEHLWVCECKRENFLLKLHIIHRGYIHMRMLALTVRGWALLSEVASGSLLPGDSAEQWPGSVGHHLWKNKTHKESDNNLKHALHNQTKQVWRDTG